MFKRAYILCLFMMFLNTMTPVIGQARKSAFVIEDDQMVLYINLKLSKAAIDSLLRVADIQGIKADRLVNGDYNELQKNGWTIKNLQSGQLVISKSLEDLGQNPQIKPVLITRNMAGGDVDEKRPGYPGKVAYGINNFSRQTVHDLPSGGFTRFFLPGNTKARRVLLSGNFNNWNTLKGFMTKTDSGWVADIKLQPGKYYYKFIIDGHWMYDQYNRLLEDDGDGNQNSAYYRYNYTFKLAGYSKAKRVVVLGSFNNWNGNELLLTERNGIWSRSLYLGEGTQSYYFLVDAKPVIDPANSRTGVNATGNPVSVINLGTTTVFKLKGFLNARDVCIAGEFNNWKPGETHLKHVSDGWQLSCILPAGNYGYKFIVDGNWMRDPANPYQCVGADEVNSFVSVKPNHTFILHGYDKAKSVHLSGTFNNWSDFGYTMKHEGNDWKISINLKPGKQLYKFTVDGNWIIDPGNKLWEQNEFGTGNSVLWFE